MDVCQSSTTEHSRSETGILNGCLSPQARSSFHRTTLQCLRGVDGDGRVVTIGYALAPQEDTLSYLWFIDLIKSLEICDGLSFGSVFNCKGTVVFSDRQKGLGSVVRDLCSESTHCACCFHLLENTRKRDRALEPKTFWWVQAAVTVQELTPECKHGVRPVQILCVICKRRLTPAQSGPHTSISSVKSGLGAGEPAISLKL